MGDSYSGELPATTRQIRSTVTAAGALEIDIGESAVAPPAEDEVVIRVEAAPVNPSDIMTLLPGADPASGRRDGGVTLVPLGQQAFERARGRLGQPLTIGLEGAGTVVAAGDKAQHLLGSRVAALALSRGMFAQYKTVNLTECVPLPGNVSLGQAAGMFCNPMTALAIVETVRLEGHAALVHTAAASNLGQMLVRICREDGVPLVNVVRREEQVKMLEAIGAEHIVNSSKPDFREKLREAIRATGATIAFDAIGGGTMVGDLLHAFEDVAVARLSEYNPYGSYEAKQVYIYGHLDTSPTLLSHENYGLLWEVRNWYMPGTIGRVGPERATELQMRVVRDIATTFASQFSHEISLEQLLDPKVLIDINRMASGQKYLVNPTL